MHDIAAGMMIFDEIFPTLQIFPDSLRESGLKFSAHK